MEQTRDIEFPQKAAEAGGRFIREYLDELRERGVKGKLGLLVKEGKTRLHLDYREQPQTKSRRLLSESDRPAHLPIRKRRDSEITSEDKCQKDLEKQAGPVGLAPNRF